ncbi:Geminivirus AR1/BR1 coat protein [Corchorus capsularis]|uniref:Geminivirus AR1/BR1 coat protein n=1 Tax=Corchorus capsularis TaxID=210143 RepID=A0A1R3JTK4_COCAP|nr:Geminivirus AR1/BR1 coat protein [Corchorus capsularis]
MYSLRYKRFGSVPVRRPLFRRSVGRRSFVYKRAPKGRTVTVSPKPHPDKLSYQRIHENQYGSTYAFMNNTSSVSFITYPRLGGPEPNRTRAYVKLNRLRYKGTVNIEHIEADVAMGVSSIKVEGVFTMAIVIDRKPHVGPTGSLPKFEELFGANVFCHGSLDIVPHLKDRYYIRHVYKRVVSTDKESVLLNLSGSMVLSSPRYSCWASFRDLDVDSCNGGYTNVGKNALLVYYCWMSDVPSKASTDTTPVRVSVVLPPFLKGIVDVGREEQYLARRAEKMKIELKGLKMVYANSLGEMDPYKLPFMSDLMERRAAEDDDEALVIFYSNKLQRLLSEEGALERELKSSVDDFNPISFNSRLRDINPGPPLEDTVEPIPVRKKHSSMNRLAALAEIYDMLQVICFKYELPLALTWVCGDNRTVSDSYNKLTLSLESTSSYYIDFASYLFMEICSQYNLEERQGIAGKALQSNEPFLFEPDITQHEQPYYPFASDAREFGSHGVVAICLENNYTDDIYVIEFFIPPSKEKPVTPESLAHYIFDNLSNMKKRFVTLRNHGSTKVDFQKEAEISNINDRHVTMPMRSSLPASYPDEIRNASPFDHNQQWGETSNSKTGDASSSLNGMVPINAPILMPYHRVQQTQGPHDELAENADHTFEPKANNEIAIVNEANLVNELPLSFSNGKKRKSKSDVWNEFSKEKDPKDGKVWAKCSHCNKKFDGSSKLGTTHLRNHLNRCPSKKAKLTQKDPEPTPLPGRGSEHQSVEGNFSFDQDRSNLDTARLFIEHQLPLNMVESESFSNLLKNLQPKFKLQSQEALSSDILCVYKEEKGRLIEYFDEEIRKSWHRFEASYPLSTFYISFDGSISDPLAKHKSSELNASVSKTPSACLLQDIFNVYKKQSQHEKDCPLMNVKYDNNWRSCSLVLAIAAILDPRLKFDFVEYLYKKVYGNNSARDHLEVIRSDLTKIFNVYASNFCGAKPKTLLDDTNSLTSLNAEENILESFQKWRKVTTNEASWKLELDKYLQEEPEPLISSQTDQFEVLGWWSEHALKFPVVGRMARDILAIPMSTVIQGSSLDEKVMMDNPVFKGLAPQIIEAMICCKHWLESPKQTNMRENTSCPTVELKDSLPLAPSSPMELSSESDEEAPPSPMDLESSSNQARAGLWSEKDVRTYLKSPLTEREKEYLSKFQASGLEVGPDKILDKALAPLLLIPPSDDVHLQNPQQYYIDDTVVNKFFILLQRKYDKFPSKYLKHHSFDSAAAVFLPMCLNKHWLLFCADIDNKNLLWLDSLEYSQSDVKAYVYEKDVIRKWFKRVVLPAMDQPKPNDIDWSYIIPTEVPV